MWCSFWMELSLGPMDVTGVKQELLARLQVLPANLLLVSEATLQKMSPRQCRELTATALRPLQYNDMWSNFQWYKNNGEHHSHASWPEWVLPYMVVVLSMSLLRNGIAKCSLPSHLLIWKAAFECWDGGKRACARNFQNWLILKPSCTSEGFGDNFKIVHISSSQIF